MLTSSPLLCIFLLSCFNDKLSKDVFTDCPDSCECYSAPKDGDKWSLTAYSVICKNIAPIQQIKQLSNHSINTFGFVNVNVYNLPDQYFSGLSINNLVYFNDKKYHAPNKNSVFDPLSGMIAESLKVLTFINMDLDSYNWGTLSNMKNLSAIHVENCTFTELNEYKFNSVSGENLKSIRIDNTGLYHIDYNVFNQWTNLKMLTITNNKIRDLHWVQNTLKLPHLWSLDLSNNEIEEIPSGFFNSFPAMKKLKLENNNIKFFREELFRPVLMEGKLHEFSFQGVSFCGHVSLKWLFSLNYNDPTIIYPSLFKYSVINMFCRTIDRDLGPSPPPTNCNNLFNSDYFHDWNCNYNKPAYN